MNSFLFEYSITLIIHNAHTGEIYIWLPPMCKLRPGEYQCKKYHVNAENRVSKSCFYKLDIQLILQLNLLSIYDLFVSPSDGKVLGEFL